MSVPDWWMWRLHADGPPDKDGHQRRWAYCEPDPDPKKACPLEHVGYVPFSGFAYRRLAGEGVPPKPRSAL